MCVCGVSQHEQFPLAYPLLPPTTRCGRQQSEGIHPFPRCSAGLCGCLISQEDTERGCCYHGFARETFSKHTALANKSCRRRGHLSPVSTAVRAGDYCFAAASAPCNCTSQQRPRSVFSFTHTPPVTRRKFKLIISLKVLHSLALTQVQLHIIPCCNSVVRPKINLTRFSLQWGYSKIIFSGIRARSFKQMLRVSY